MTTSILSPEQVRSAFERATSECWPRPGTFCGLSAQNVTDFAAAIEAAVIARLAERAGVMPKPLLEGVDHELWGQNITTDCFTADQLRTHTASLAARVEVLTEALRFFVEHPGVHQLCTPDSRAMQAARATLNPTKPAGECDDVLDNPVSAVRALGVIEPAQRWISVEERLPANHVRCVVTSDGGIEQFNFDYREDDCWMQWTDDYQHIESIGGRPSDLRPITHWFELPAPAAPQQPKD